MLVLLVLIEENAKGTVSLDSLACEIFLLLYLFSSSCVVVIFLLFSFTCKIKLDKLPRCFPIHLMIWFMLPVQLDMLPCCFPLHLMIYLFYVATLLLMIYFLLPRCFRIHLSKFHQLQSLSKWLSSSSRSNNKTRRNSTKRNNVINKEYWLRQNSHHLLDHIDTEEDNTGTPVIHPVVGVEGEGQKIKTRIQWK